VNIATSPQDKAQGTKSGRRVAVFYRIMLTAAALIILIIAGVTVWALLIRGPAETGGEAPKAETRAEGGQAADGGIKIWTGLGRLRAPLAQDAGTVVLTIAFPYNSDDLPFSGELAASIGAFREEIHSYFSVIKASDPLLTREDDIKAALLARFNGKLLLGKIETLYFYDYMVL
jgi:flagellar basal body-associated protein FliL